MSPSKRGSPPSLLQSLEQGRTANPRLSTLLGLAKVYHVTVDTLIDGIQLTELQSKTPKRVTNILILKDRPPT